MDAKEIKALVVELRCQTMPKELTGDPAIDALAGSLCNLCQRAATALTAALADREDAERHRFARTIFAIEDVERAAEEAKGFTASDEENEKYDAAIDAAR